MEEIIKELLEETGKIYEAEKKNLESGNLFNIFEILHLEHYETKTHSLILAELLSPQGRHGCKDQFLKVFLKVVLKDESFLHTNDAIVEVEKGIGQLDNDYEQGGRIDILIHDDNNAIVIENKIDAGDQPKQLYRYCRYAQTEYHNNYRVLYLTLNGKNPSERSVIDADTTNVSCKSYKKDIKEWLDECINLVAEKSNVKNSLNQYLYIIKKLTNQDMETNKLTSKIAGNLEYMISASIINDNFQYILHQMCKIKVDELCENVAQKLGLTYDKPYLGGNENRGYYWYNKYSGVSFTKDEWKHFSVSFEFLKDNLEEFIFGVKFLSSIQEAEKETLSNRVKDEFGRKNPNNQWYPWSIQDEKYPKWTCKEAISALYDGTMQKHIEFKLKEIASKVDKIEKL